MKYVIQRGQLFEYQMFELSDPQSKTKPNEFKLLCDEFKKDMDDFKSVALKLNILALMQLT